ncbi:MAG: IgGFc binding protein [Ignavibacteria bacterium]|nr:IgGFc binding protein [Ignavibacteria bacterium]
MEMPVFTWGKYYHVTITPGLSKSSSIRVFAKESNTTIFRDGKQVSFVKTYGGIIGEGYQELQITPPESPMKPVVISGDKPINIMLYNTGYKDDVNPLNNSRPFWMAQVPIEQYQKEITFFPPPVIESSGKMNHYLKLICQLDSTGNIPDDMQFGEPDSGKILWSQYNRKFPGQIDTFAYDIYGKKFGVQILPLLKSGVFKIKSPKAFIAYSFGNDTVKSYGFPSATGLMDLSRDDLFPPVPKFKLLCNGSLEGGLGTVTDMPDNDSIRSNLSVVTYLKDESYNYSFTFKDFVPGESRTTSWSIEPYDMSKDARAVITFTDRRGNDTTIIIEYKSLKLSITPNNFDFGRVKFGSEQTQTFQIKNESDDKVRVTQISMASNGKQNFEIVNNPVPFSLGQLESRTFSLKFKSLKEGDDFRDSIRIGDSCRLFPAALVKAKVGFPIIIVGENPNEKCDMDFNKIFTNEINRKSIQILNLGSSSMELSRIKGPFSQNFRAINISNFPIRIEPGNSIQMDVEFQSESEGKFRDSIIFSSDATNIDSVATLCAEAVISDVKENITKDNYTISIYPNPVIDEGIIKLRTDGLPHGIYISDIFGRRIQEIDFTNANSSEGAIYRFDASQLAQGLYFLNVSDGGRVVVRKFIIGR